MPAKKITKVHLHKRGLVATMPSVRQLVIDSMREKKLTAYGLAKLVAPKLTEQTIQNFLNGGDMKASTLDVLMPVLGLEIIKRDTVRIPPHGNQEMASPRRRVSKRAKAR